MRCPKCQSRGSPKTLTVKCVCEQDCPYVICRVCGHADHPFHFIKISSTAMAAKKEEPEESRTQEQRGFWPDDDTIRGARPPFVIEERHAGNSAIWRRFVKGHWQRFSQQDALRLASLERELLDRQKAGASKSI